MKRRGFLGALFASPAAVKAAIEAKPAPIEEVRAIVEALPATNVDKDAYSVRYTMSVSVSCDYVPSPRHRF